MGICMSCDHAKGDAGLTYTASTKLVLPDGELREFELPVMAIQVLEEGNYDVSAWSICDADEMELDGFVSAVDELLPGQIYFVLPNSKLRHRLHADDLVALAVKASAALSMRAVAAKSVSKSLRKRRVAPQQPLIFTNVNPVSPVRGSWRQTSRMMCDPRSNLKTIQE